MRIIPAIDIIDGKCVRLSKGDYETKKVYDGTPLEIAKEFEANGIEYLHLVDLDGAKAKRIINHKVLEELCKRTNLKIDFGGGLKGAADIQMAFDAGASQVTVGSIAVKKPELFKSWVHKYGVDKIILGADCKNRKIASAGWTESSEIDVVDFINSYKEDKIKYVVCTDISKDGMLQGPAFDLYLEIMKRTEVELIASGGVSSMEDLMKLSQMGCAGAIVGKAFYEGKISLNELSSLC